MDITAGHISSLLNCKNKVEFYIVKLSPLLSKKEIDIEDESMQ